MGVLHGGERKMRPACCCLACSLAAAAAELATSPTLIMVPVVVHFRRLDGVRCAMNKDKLARLQAQVRTGGKGSVRRKKKAVHKTTTTGECSPAPGRSRVS